MKNNNKKKTTKKSTPTCLYRVISNGWESTDNLYFKTKSEAIDYIKSEVESGSIDFIDVNDYLILKVTEIHSLEASSIVTKPETLTDYL